jgi:hypothetical protein
MLLIVTSLFMIGLTGCDMFGGEDVPDPCPEGFELQGTECIAITDGDAPVITLLGDATITIAQGSTYTDAGATASDTEDGNLTSDIVVNDTVNENVVGTYTVTYDVTDSDGNAATTVTRTVIVAAPGDNDPVLTLNGNTTMTISAGDPFVDPEATASDFEDGDITSSITKTGTVNVNVAGTYVITYSITDSDNNTVTTTRTVIVTASEAEILANYIVDNWDGSLQFLGLTMANMDLSSAMNMSFDLSFVVTEDIDESHYIEASVTDQYLYEETGDTLHRTIDLDIDGEQQLTMSMIYQEVETGLHVYIEYRPIFDLLYMENPEMIDTLGWVGFDDEWALFQLDDTLQNVIQVEVVKEMLVALFFSEMGDYFFTDLQEQMIEEAIGFHLNQYGVDLGAFIDLLIEEDFDAAELMLQDVETDNIVLHIDHLYLAWQLNDFLMMYETELSTAGFVMSQLDLLDTATEDPITGEVTLSKLTVDSKPDPMYGTQVFFEQMTEAQFDILVEHAIKPFIEEMVYFGISSDLVPDNLDSDMEMILTNYQDFLADHWPMSSSPFDYATELAALQAADALTYWKDLTYEERDVFQQAIENHFRGWSVWNLQDYFYNGYDFQPMLVRYGEEFDVELLEQNVKGLINDNAIYVSDNYEGFDVSVWITGIDEEGLLFWYQNLSPEEKDMIQVIYNLPGMEPYNGVIDDLEHYSMRPWDYQYWYQYEYGQISSENVTWDIEEILWNNQDYFETDYGYNVQDLIDEIHSYDHKAIEWYLYHTDSAMRDHLYEASQMMWDDHYMWTLEELNNLYWNNYDYEVFYGRSEEMFDYWYLSGEFEQLIWNNQGYLDSTYPGVDYIAWIDAVWADGLPMFWDSLSQTEKDILEDISNQNDGWYRWPIELMIMRDNNPEGFRIAECNWGWCLDETSMTEDMTQLLNDFSGYLSDNGYDATTMIANISAYGITNWYMMLDDHAREVLEEVSNMANWEYEVLNSLWDMMYTEDDLINFISSHETALNDLGFPATAALTSLQTDGLQAYVENVLTIADVEALFDSLVYPELEALSTAFTDGEVPEYLMDLIFNDPHVDALLGQLSPTPEFDPFDVLDMTNLQANLLAVDFDALALETVDLELLFDAIYNGSATYATFMTGLETTAPNSELILSLFAPAVESLQPYMYVVDEFNYAMDGLSIFEPYFNMTYWLDDSDMDMDLAVTDDFYIETEMTMTPIMYQVVVQDLLDDINTYLSGFEIIPFPYDSEWECLPSTDPNYDPYCEDMDIADLMSLLAQFGDIGMLITYDPSNPTWMEMQVQLADLLDAIAQENYDMISSEPGFVPDNNNDIITGVTDASITITMGEGGTVTMPAPADVDDVNAIADEFGKFGIAMFARDYLRDLMWYYENNPSELADLILAGNQTYSVNEFYAIRTSAAFDNEASEISVVVDVVNQTAEFSVTLYWIDGTEALDGTISLNDFEALFNMDNELQGQAAYDQMKAFVNEDNYRLTKLWLMFLLQEDDHDVYKDNGMYR